MEKLKIEITVEEANIVLAALGQQPYVKVADLIQKIQRQGADQLQKGSPDVMPELKEKAKRSLVTENGK